MNGKRRSLPVTLAVAALGAVPLLALLAIAAQALAAQDAAFVMGKAGQQAEVPAGLCWAFYIIGGLTVIGALATVTRRNPVVAAVCLVMTLIGTAGLYLLLHATFIAAIQVLVYAGAIMVLFIFVIMAVERPEQEKIGVVQNAGSKIIGVVALALVLARVLAVFLGGEIKSPGEVAGTFGDVSAVGRLLFSEYLLPFEAISVLLLTAIVGAVVVSRRRAQRAPS